jgi:hypothetical protein
MCYSSEVELYFSLDVSFDSMWDWKIVLKKAGVSSRRKVYIKMMILPVRFRRGVRLLL